MEQGIIGQDVFLRYDGGPVQCFRAWDVKRFVESQVEQGLTNKDNGEPAPYVVTLATLEEYRAEHRK